MSTVEQAEQRGGIIAYRASAELIAEIEAAAAAEGITRSDVARRAVMRDLARSGTARSPYPHRQSAAGNPCPECTEPACLS